MEKETIYKVKIEKKQQGTRIDLVLSLALPQISRSYLQKLIGSGAVTIDGTVCGNKKCKVEEGQEVVIVLPEPQPLNVEAEDIPLDIVYEDEDLLVVNKPKGMVVHPAA
ncbi:MAG: RluA family pseudouridine synthase, partial [Clostridia bacterium]|nr:RluA family pseudouridine synthase [Clostridia bacterium]